MKKILLKIGNWISGFFRDSVQQLEKIASDSVIVVDILKSVVGSPIAAAVVALTPTKADDAALAAAKHILILVSKEIMTLRGIMNLDDKVEFVIDRLTKYISRLSSDDRSLFYVELSGRITRALADGKITIAEAITITQFIYANR